MYCSTSPALRLLVRACRESRRESRLETSRQKNCKESVVCPAPVRATWNTTEISNSILTQDNLKHLFLARADTRSRQEFDAGNSDITSRLPIAFAVMSDLWNSNAFNPIAPASDCYVDFLSAIDCSYHEHEAGLSPATPQPKN